MNESAAKSIGVSKKFLENEFKDSLKKNKQKCISTNTGSPEYIWSIWLGKLLSRTNR